MTRLLIILLLIVSGLKLTAGTPGSVRHSLALVVPAGDPAANGDEDDDPEADQKGGKTNPENEKEDEFPPATPDHASSLPPARTPPPALGPQPIRSGIADELFMPPDRA
ncbi:hypothetical protein V9K67_01200 [Paraflavisolibacter sp. H34]|uniref:hypothetical protein n=1 Tax=Huijunlia imazamoxiresistens TaxID=3127457 RepID=UPI00301655C7